MQKEKFDTSTISQDSYISRKLSNDEYPIQLELFPLAHKPRKPQIATIPGVHPTELKRYRITLGGRVIGDWLTCDEAIALAKGGK